jgi:HAD superfamily hydrolase (TIGR01484 family)
MNYLFCDFDGTLTEKGQIGEKFYQLFKKLKKIDYELIIVSGRSMAWGHFLLTHFPLRYSIMEGGGVVLKKEKSEVENYYHCDAEALMKIEKITKRLLLKFSNLHLSSDSHFRKTDRAIPLQSMDEKTLKNVQDFLDKNEIYHSCSNIHLNFWAGSFTKYSSIEYWANKLENVDFHQIKKQCLYIGDGLNDESVFEHFENTHGVQNIQKNIDRFKFKPKFITPSNEIEGVLEIVDKYLN